MGCWEEMGETWICLYAEQEEWENNGRRRKGMEFWAHREVAAVEERCLLFWDKREE